MFGTILSLIRLYEINIRRRFALSGSTPDLERAAVTSLKIAVEETKAYLDSSMPGGENRAVVNGTRTKREICRLWAGAAKKLLPVDGDLASQCLLKSYYWADPPAGPVSERSRAELSHCLIELQILYALRFGDQAQGPIRSCHQKGALLGEAAEYSEAREEPIRCAAGQQHYSSNERR